MTGFDREVTYMTDPGGLATVRFSTADLPEQARVAMWREYYGHSVLKVDIEPADVASFEATATLSTLPGLQVVSGMLTPARITRTRALIADGNDDFLLLVNRTGHAIASARGRQVALCEKDAVLIGCGETITFDRRSAGSSLSFRIARSILCSLIPDAEDAVMHHIPRGTAALGLLTCYANALLDPELAAAAPALRRHVATHVHDLVALALGATGDVADVAKSRGAGAARLRAAKTYIIENVSCRDISIGAVASHLGLTPRYLQRLFENDGTTFSAFLLGRRLARAHRMLYEPQTAERRVSAIAYDVGFGDLSYFNRCFRRLYGATPMDVREAATRQEFVREECRHRVASAHKIS
jgi:AraC-like DNA-binding protein